MNRFELLEERTSGIKYIIELVSEKIKMIVVYFSDDNWNMMYIHYENAASSHGKNHKLLNLYTNEGTFRGAKKLLSSNFVHR